MCTQFFFLDSSLKLKSMEKASGFARSYCVGFGDKPSFVGVSDGTNQTRSSQHIEFVPNALKSAEPLLTETDAIENMTKPCGRGNHHHPCKGGTETHWLYDMLGQEKHDQAKHP